MPLLLKNIRSGQRRALITELNSAARTELEKVLDQQVKPTLTKSLKKVTEDWEHDVEFQGRKYIKPDSISVTAFPVGPNANIFKYVDKGTSPHVIVPKNVPRLVFQTGYQPKTLARPARTVSGRGVATGPTVYAKKVQHPGSEGRDFTGTIAEDIKPDFKRTIENTFRQISRMMEE